MIQTRRNLCKSNWFESQFFQKESTRGVHLVVECVNKGQVCDFIFLQFLMVSENGTSDCSSIVCAVEMVYNFIYLVIFCLSEMWTSNWQLVILTQILIWNLRKWQQLKIFVNFYTALSMYLLICKNAIKFRTSRNLHCFRLPFFQSPSRNMNLIRPRDAHQSSFFFACTRPSEVRGGVEK